MHRPEVDHSSFVDKSATVNLNPVGPVLLHLERTNARSHTHTHARTHARTHIHAHGVWFAENLMELNSIGPACGMSSKCIAFDSGPPSPPVRPAPQRAGRGGSQRAKRAASSPADPGPLRQRPRLLAPSVNLPREHPSCTAYTARSSPNKVNIFMCHTFLERLRLRYEISVGCSTVKQLAVLLVSPLSSSWQPARDEVVTLSGELELEDLSDLLYLAQCKRLNCKGGPAPAALRTGKNKQ